MVKLRFLQTQQVTALSLISLQLLSSAAAESCSESSMARIVGNCEDSDSFSALQKAARPRLNASRKADSLIPKIVHHMYKYDISSGPWPNAIWQQSFTAWKTLFPEPEYAHKFWSDAEVLAFIEHRCPKYHEVFTNEKRDIVRADFARYCIMWRLGGIYADLDYEPLRNFYADLRPGKVNLVQSPYMSETYQNSLMASPTNYSYWEKLMDLAQFTMNSKNILLAAGPQLLETLPLTHDSSVVHALSCNSFQRATHTLDDRERQASLRKNCKLLQPTDFTDLSLKGIHWGTVSYFPQHDATKPYFGFANWGQKAAPELPAGLASLFAAYRSAHEAFEFDGLPGGKKRTQAILGSGHEP